MRSYVIGAVVGATLWVMGTHSVYSALTKRVKPVPHVIYDYNLFVGGSKVSLKGTSVGVKEGCIVVNLNGRIDTLVCGDAVITEAGGVVTPTPPAEEEPEPSSVGAPPDRLVAKS